MPGKGTEFDENVVPFYEVLTLGNPLVKILFYYIY